MVLYWTGAIERSFWAACHWIFEQGLTPGRIALAIGALVIAAGLAWRRYLRGLASREETYKALGAATKTFAVFLASGVLMACTAVFGFYLLVDAPTQIVIATDRAIQAEAKLDEREARRKFRSGVSKLLGNGYQLLGRAPVGNASSVTTDEVNNWLDSVLTFLKENNMADTYVRLLDQTILGQLGGHPPQTPSANQYLVLWTVTSNMQKMLKECE
jgi:hypothetical protein